MVGHGIISDFGAPGRERSKSTVPRLHSSTSASFRTSELEEAARALTRRIQRPEPIAHIYPADDPKLEQVLSKLRVSLRKRTATAAGGDGGVRGLARHFRIVDRNGNGALDPSEFFKVCALNRLPLLGRRRPAAVRAL